MGKKMDIQVNILNEYKRWIDCASDEEIKQELFLMKDNFGEINESFYKELDFGTSGMRGILGAKARLLLRKT